jgi:hypothetical protein
VPRDKSGPRTELECELERIIEDQKVQPIAEADIQCGIPVNKEAPAIDVEVPLQDDETLAEGSWDLE